MDKVKIKHVDGVTNVLAKVHLGQSEINLEYKFEGMTYGRTIGLEEAIKLGIIECSHPSMNPMLGFENSIVGEVCCICGKEFPHLGSTLFPRHSSVFKTNYTDNDNE
jgi:hypothetical protein